MIFEHEIPAGSRLYFGESARIKRQIERIASQILEARGFAEISTPLFSYHQHMGVRDDRALIRLADPQNRELTLRADSTIDVVRLVTKRLGRSVDQKKWFYIQPVYRYPTEEINQIGAEWLGGELADVLGVMSDLLEALETEPVYQISNIRIPRLISEHFNVPLTRFEKMDVAAFLDADLPWLAELARVQSPEDLEKALPNMPDVLQAELARMKELADACRCARCVLAPLYYAKMRYYDGLFFRCFAGNTPLASGGHFVDDDISAAGFALYTDALIEIRQKGMQKR
ncbi:MAG: ATP phosphoribosyltransferase regulatory subunit [Epsilonproteobacteria bacterium]|nr:ATP phosphoribosyltransferase regulatory subunit [Campylobacterota bacterium]